MSDFPDFLPRVVQSEAVPPGVLYLYGESPRREDYPTDDEWSDAYLRRIFKITAGER